MWVFTKRRAMSPDLVDVDATACTVSVASVGDVVSRNQFGFLIGVLLVWLAWDAGWVVLAAVAAGLIGLGIVRVLDGGLDLGDLGDQIRSSAKRSR